MTTQEEIKAGVQRLTDLADNYFTPGRFIGDGAELQVSFRKAAALIERLAAEKESGEFWRGVFDEITDKTDREKIEAELSDYHFMMEQVPTVYMHITGGKMSKCNYYDHAVIAEADEYQNKLIDEAVQEALERSKDASTSVSAHIKPLVWKKRVTGVFRAETPVGMYEIVNIDREKWQLSHLQPIFEIGVYSSQATAETAASDHLVERISPMLTEGPSPAAPTPAIPEGWKLVPIEPTPEMARCLESNIAECLPASEVHVANWRNAYRAMLNASPAPGGDQK